MDLRRPHFDRASVLELRPAMLLLSALGNRRRISHSSVAALGVATSEIGCPSPSLRTAPKGQPRGSREPLSVGTSPQLALTQPSVKALAARSGVGFGDLGTSLDFQISPHHSHRSNVTTLIASVQNAVRRGVNSAANDPQFQVQSSAFDWAGCQAGRALRLSPRRTIDQIQSLQPAQLAPGTAPIAHH